MKFLKAHLKKLLLVAGIVTLVALVRHVGLDAVLDVLRVAGPWFPLIVFLEIFLTGTDAIALALFYREHAGRVPLRDWLRSTAVHYGVMVVLPAGRAGAEVTRGAMLSRYVGPPRASAGVIQVQCVTLLANTFISLVCYVAVASASGPASALGLLLLGNGAITGVVGVGTYLSLRRFELGGWLGQRLKTLAAHGPEADRVFREAPAFPVKALAVCCAGRTVQAVQYGVILVAVGGTAGLAPALVSEGIHLVGAGLGDMVPNQVGITEAAYGWFADTLGLTTAAGISLALLARLSQFTLAGAYYLLATLVGPVPSTSAPDPEAPR